MWCFPLYPSALRLEEWSLRLWSIDNIFKDQIRSDQSLSRVRLFATPWIAACQASLSITISWSSLKLTSIESVMPSTISSSVVPFCSCPQSFLPASESFPMSQLFSWGAQSTGVSALVSFLPKKSQANLLQNGLVGSPCIPSPIFSLPPPLSELVTKSLFFVSMNLFLIRYSFIF